MCTEQLHASFLGQKLAEAAIITVGSALDPPLNQPLGEELSLGTVWLHPKPLNW